jgi:hypothetical protein
MSAALFEEWVEPSTGSVAPLQIARCERDTRKRAAQHAQHNAKRSANGVNKTNISPQAKGSVGRPPHEPNDKDRDFVITMVAHGVGHEEIAGGYLHFRCHAPQALQ